MKDKAALMSFLYDEIYNSSEMGGELSTLVHEY